MPRKEERKTVFTEIVLEWSSGKREARVSDLSPGGCFVDTIATATVGEVVSLELKTGSGDLDLTGEVAYILNGVGFGIKFVGLSNETSAKLQSFIDSQ